MVSRDGDGDRSAAAIIEVHEQARQVQVEWAKAETEDRTFARRSAARDAGEDRVKQIPKSAVEPSGQSRQQNLHSSWALVCVQTHICSRPENAVKLKLIA